MPKIEENLLEKHGTTYEYLKKVRASKEISFKPIPSMKSEIENIFGEKEPFKLRYYQTQAVFHLLAMRRMVLGDDTGTGKTIMMIASYLYAWEKEPDNKVIIVTLKTAVRQWESEIKKFTNGVTTFLADGSPNDRKKAYEDFLKCPVAEKPILLTSYAVLIKDWAAGSVIPLKPDGKPDLKGIITPGLLDGITRKIPKLSVTFDECSAFQNMSTKRWQVCHDLSVRCHRSYGLTATILKNRLMEAYAIYKCIYPPVFTTKTRFMDLYCKTRMQKISHNRKIPIVVGYKNLDLFRLRIDPFFLGRSKYDISDELPKLITREVVVTLSPAEDMKYVEAVEGLLMLGDGDIRSYASQKHLTSLIYCQQTVNSLTLLRYKPEDVIESPVLEETLKTGKLFSKEQALIDLLTGEFEGAKVIVYTRLASLIPRLQKLCKDEKIISTAITGKVVDTKANPARQNAMKTFQDLKSKVKVIFISDAGSEAINLQAAEVLIFYDAPWSWGNYVQILGRPIRIGSPHQHVLALHLVAERPGKKKETIDHYTLKILQKKKELINKAIGNSAQNALDLDSSSSFSRELARSVMSGSL